MQRDDLACSAQPKPQSAAIVRARGVSRAQSVEHTCQRRRCDALAGVRNAQLDVVALAS